jgi:hypothetical protein
VALDGEEHACLLWTHAKPALERGDSGGMRSVLALRVPLRA